MLIAEQNARMSSTHPKTACVSILAANRVILKGHLMLQAAEYSAHAANGAGGRAAHEGSRLSNEQALPHDYADRHAWLAHGADDYEADHQEDAYAASNDMHADGYMAAAHESAGRPDPHAEDRQYMPDNDQGMYDQSCDAAGNDQEYQHDCSPMDTGAEQTDMHAAGFGHGDHDEGYPDDHEEDPASGAPSRVPKVDCFPGQLQEL